MLTFADLCNFTMVIMGVITLVLAFKSKDN